MSFGDVLIGAVCGAMIAGGMLLDCRAKKLPDNVVRRRREIANKISMHLDLQIKGDVWTLTTDDFGIILDALGKPHNHSTIT